MRTDTDGDDGVLDEYDWEWVQGVARDGIGNYPASREALRWCVAEITRLYEEHPADAHGH